MLDVPANAQQEVLPQSLFNLTAKHTAAIFAVIYGAGFLIISIHHGRLGMYAVEPFKAKIFSAGLLFVLLTGIPCIAMARAMGLFGLRMPAIEVVEGRIGYVYISWALDFWLIAVGLRLATSILFAPMEMFPRYPGWLLFIIYCAVAGIAAPFLSLNRWPLRTILMDFVVFILGVALIYKYSSHQFFLQALWFYLIGLIFLWIRSLTTSPRLVKTFLWERQGFLILAMVLFFAAFVYGHIPSFYGGGAPIRVDLTFNRQTSFSSGTTVTGFLVDDDSHGYYLIHQEADRDTHFIPRDAVTEIVFHGGNLF